jgi:urease accessory protein
MVMAAPWATITARTAFPLMPNLALDRLRLAQILSPAFPIGSFAHSQGLEAAITSGAVHNAASLQDWIAMILQHSAARMDGLFIVLSRKLGADIDGLAALYDAYTPSQGRAREAHELGRGFQTLVGGDTDLPYAIALGQATKDMTLPEPELLALWFQSLAAQLTSAATRFMPLGQSAAQAIITNLAPTIAQLSTTISGLTATEISSFAFGADMASMAQETLSVRIFRS